eukprot:TRINITY_DN17641_c0_g1_i2.p1 TRINITY_DN17641_c0_g1~~TRINITY_DN17641_c0_g1_i2.p1  ORF type:complete len:323 (+),score=42.48 TRINITY_DN17641_c0_g1_i2:43-1011(+)
MKLWAVFLAFICVIGVSTAVFDFGTNPRPWMHSIEVHAIDFFLGRDKTMLEFGSGSSTLYFADKVKQLVSVESSKAWCGEVQNALEEREIKNVDFYCKPIGLDVGCKNLASIDSNLNSRKYLISGSTQFEDYLSVVRNHKVFDLVLIDGRARPQAAFESLAVMNADSILFFHDYHFLGRTHYQIVEEWFDIGFETKFKAFEDWRSIAIFKPKAKFLIKENRDNWLIENGPEWWFNGDRMSAEFIARYIICEINSNQVNSQSLEYFWKYGEIGHISEAIALLKDNACIETDNGSEERRVSVEKCQKIISHAENNVIPFRESVL